MKYSVERTIKIEFRGEEYSARLVMVPLRVKLALTKEDGSIDTLAFFEKSVPEVTGPDINGLAIKCGADVLDATGADDLFLELMSALGDWEVKEDELKNS